MFYFKAMFVTPFRITLLVIGWIAMTAPSLFANQWSSSVGEAKAVQSRTEDISDRLNKYFPYSQATHASLHLDNVACQMVEAVRCGASWHQVQASLQQTCSLAGEVNSLVNADCKARNDRRVRDYLVDLSKRIERLRCSLDKDYARSQPSFCPPAAYPHSSGRPTWGTLPQILSPRVPGCAPNHPHLSNGYGLPDDTYDFDNAPYRGHSIPLGRRPLEFAPLESRPGLPGSYDLDPFGSEYPAEPLPSESPIGPIEYRVQRNTPSSKPKAAAIAQIGIEVLRLALGN
jgi:hypothetical protein